MRKTLLGKQGMANQHSKNVHFYVNGTPIQLELDQADQTLLSFIREQLVLTGTKEGCASGDCGACTVIVGDFTPEGWHYRTQNACITFVRQMHGKNVVTLEALSKQGELHPAQRALIEYHGSQCGFCTPGFVMSLAALHENRISNAPLSLHEIQDALSGNLCRCTGYRPIIEAAKHMADYPQQDSGPAYWSPEQSNTSEPSSGIDTSYWNPVSEEELLAVLQAHPEARIVAGATDLALEVTQLHKHLPKLVSITDIDSLKQIELNDEHITIGSAASYQATEETLNQHYPEFGKLLNRLGSKQVRNAGTLGGNIANASPIGDTPPVLIALNAEISLASPEGERWLKLADFYLDYKKTVLQAGEYIRKIRIPRLKPNEHLKVYKISKRIEDDISAVLMALRIEHNGSHIQSVGSGFGGMAAIPKSAPTLEASLKGQPLSIASFEQASAAIGQDFLPLSDVRASANYRLEVSQGLLIKCAYELIEPAPLSRVEDICSLERVSHAPSYQAVLGGDHA